MKKVVLLKSQYLKIYPSGSKPGILYEQAEVPKSHSVSNWYTNIFDLVKFLAPILKPLTKKSHFHLRLKLVNLTLKI